MNEKPTIRTRVTDAANELDQLFQDINFDARLGRGQRHKQEEVEDLLTRLIIDGHAILGAVESRGVMGQRAAAIRHGDVVSGETQVNQGTFGSEKP